MRLKSSGSPVDPAKTYAVAGWASVNQGVQGPAVWDLVAKHITDRKVVTAPEAQLVKVVGD